MDSKYGKFPVFDGVDYSVWKNKMCNFIKGTDYECWIIIKNGPLAITKAGTTASTLVVKPEEEYEEADYKKTEKNAKAMSLL